jgi:hypothetical protein
MPDIVPYVLAAWVVLSVALFWRRPGAGAAVLAMVGGWVFLPNASYPARVFGEPYGFIGTMHALAFPTGVLFNKATAIGLGCVSGVVLFDWPAVRRFRPSWLDAPVAAWVLTPIASGLANGLTLAEGLAQSRHLALAWGVPYFLGRLYFGSNRALEGLAVGLVVAGLAYAPLELLEFVIRPSLYEVVYGRHPYLFDGAERPLGFRPLVFTEHGNQLGMWAAVVAVAAVWLWRAGRLGSVLRVPGGLAAAGLVAVCLIDQSHGAIILMVAALAALFLAGRLTPGTTRMAPVAATAAAVLLLGVAAFVAAEGPTAGGLRSAIRNGFSSAGKPSFTWRLGRGAEFLPVAAEHPVLGRGRADWYVTRGTVFKNPVAVGFWLDSFGMYGAAGLTFSYAVMVLPVAVALRKVAPRDWPGGPRSAVALTAVLLGMSAADSLLNSVLLLPLLAGAGGLISWSVESGGHSDRRGAEAR